MAQIVHTVLLDLDPAKPAEVDTAVDALRGLHDQPGVMSLSIGPDVSPEGLSGGHTHALVVVFESAAARDHYLTAPAHLAAVADLQACLRRVTVVDIEA